MASWNSFHVMCREKSGNGSVSLRCADRARVPLLTAHCLQRSSCYSTASRPTVTPGGNVPIDFTDRTTPGMNDDRSMLS
jgi:hypothetical protein